jgi:hypothetical protein
MPALLWIAGRPVGAAAGQAGVRWLRSVRRLGERRHAVVGDAKPILTLVSRRGISLPGKDRLDTFEPQNCEESNRGTSGLPSPQRVADLRSWLFNLSATTRNRLHPIKPFSFNVRDEPIVYIDSLARIRGSNPVI